MVTLMVYLVAQVEELEKHSLVLKLVDLQHQDKVMRVVMLLQVLMVLLVAVVELEQQVVVAPVDLQECLVMAVLVRLLIQVGALQLAEDRM